MLSAAIGKVIPIDRCDNHMGKSELCRSVGDMLRLSQIQWSRNSGSDGAESARARTGIPHDHEGPVLLFPALPDIGAAGLLADSSQAVRAYNRLGLAIPLRTRRLYPDPRWLLKDSRIRPVRFLRMAHRPATADGVEHDDHRNSQPPRKPDPYLRTVVPCNK